MNQHNESQQVLELWHYAEGLQKEVRAGVLSNGREESVAEHSWRISFIALIVASRLEHKVDQGKLLKLAIIHDFAEIETTDISLHLHAFDINLKKQKDLDEQKAMTSLVKKYGKIGREIYEIWEEYEKQETIESKIIKAIDKLDPRINIIDSLITETWSKERKQRAVILGSKTTEYCSIDSFLSELDSLSLTERKLKYGF